MNCLFCNKIVISSWGDCDKFSEYSKVFRTCCKYLNNELDTVPPWNFSNNGGKNAQHQEQNPWFCLSCYEAGTKLVSLSSQLEELQAQIWSVLQQYYENLERSLLVAEEQDENLEIHSFRRLALKGKPVAEERLRTDALKIETDSNCGEIGPLSPEEPVVFSPESPSDDFVTEIKLPEDNSKLGENQQKPCPPKDKVLESGSSYRRSNYDFIKLKRLEIRLERLPEPVNTQKSNLKSSPQTERLQRLRNRLISRESETNSKPRRKPLDPGKLGRTHGPRRHRTVTPDGRIMYGEIEIKCTEYGAYQCPKCELFYTSESIFISHIKKYHPSNRTVNGTDQNCKPKPKRIVTLPDGRLFYTGIEIQRLDDGRHRCGKCRVVYKSKIQVQVHIRLRHVNDVRPLNSRAGPRLEEVETPEGQRVLRLQGIELIPQAEGRCICGRCQKLFSTRAGCVQHVRTYHLGQLKPRSTTGRKVNKTEVTADGRKIYAGVEIQSVGTDEFRCGACGKVYTNRRKSLTLIMSHIVWNHEEASGKFACTICGKNCGYQFRLTKHMLKHKEAKTFTCEECGLSYKQSASLEHHVRQKHRGEKRHTCPDCGKQFYLTRDFIVHQRTHTGERPFVCDQPQCGKAFTSIYALKNHKKIHNKS